MTPRQRLTLDDLLERWIVLDEWDNSVTGLDGWYAVASDDGIVAYFGNRADAYRWRLAMINRELNP